MTPNDRIPLRLLGLSYARLKNSAFMLILAEVGGPRHLNIWIGEAEAHSIAIAMEGVKPPRPLTHDLFASFAHAFGVKLREVFIYSVDDDVYASELTFTDRDGRSVGIDARTSDAVAIAIRTGAPIFTTRAILESKGFVLDLRRSDDGDGETDNDNADEADDDEQETPQADPTSHGLDSAEPYERYAIEELERTLKLLIEQERYEEAARVSDILRQKRGE